MTDIEERAERYGRESANLLCSEWTEDQREKQAKVYAKVYSKIATEQKAIDIEKACEYLRREYRQMNAIINRICVKDEGDLIDVDASIDSFLKAMEE